MRGTSLPGQSSAMFDMPNRIGRAAHPLHAKTKKQEIPMNTILEKAYPIALKKERGISVSHTCVPDDFRLPRDKYDPFLKELRQQMAKAEEENAWPISHRQP